MNDQEFESQVERIKKVIDKLSPILALEYWDVSHEFVREEFEVDGHNAKEATAAVNPMWQYMSALIKWNVPRCADMEDEDLEHAFIHEACHIWLAEMREWQGSNDALNHEERVAESFARLLDRLRPQEEKDA